MCSASAQNVSKPFLTAAFGLKYCSKYYRMPFWFLCLRASGANHGTNQRTAHVDGTGFLHPCCMLAASAAGSLQAAFLLQGLVTTMHRTAALSAAP